jgi:hypothetical protein
VWAVIWEGEGVPRATTLLAAEKMDYATIGVCGWDVVVGSV